MGAFTDEYHYRFTIWSDIEDHLEYIYEKAREHQGPFVELGVRKGFSTAAFLAAIEGTEKHLWSIDIDPPDVPSWWSQNPQWHFHQGDDISQEALRWAPENIGILFVDTSHSVAQTTRELELYMPRVRKGGIALFHDTQWLPPAVVLPEPGGPVTEALNKYCSENNLTWENRKGHMYGMGMIKV